MAILQVAGLGQAVLRRKAVKVDPAVIETPAFQEFANCLLESMMFHQGVGLAAPQVFQSIRVFAFWVPPELDEGNEGVEPMVLVNPELEEMSAETEEGWEGCLSLRDLRGVVPRHTSLLLRALDIKGKPIEKRYQGYPARVLQHEFDHLNGIVFVDRMPDLSSLGFEREITRGAEDDD
jgi:peptide deformylase